MSRFSLPIPLARLHPLLTSDDMIFIRDLKNEGKSNIDAFKILLASKSIEIPLEIDALG